MACWHIDEFTVKWMGWVVWVGSLRLGFICFSKQFIFMQKNGDYKIVLKDVRRGVAFFCQQISFLGGLSALTTLVPVTQGNVAQIPAKRAAKRHA
jgi:hypothetical protein